MAVLNPKFDPPDMPPYIPYDRSVLQKLGVAGDKNFYQLSDQDFAARHPQLRSAEKLFETQTLKDQAGDGELLPAIQGEFQRAGLAGALGSFGDSMTTDGGIGGGTIAPGSAAEASVARNLGTSIAGFQDRNRNNRLTSLATAEQLFPRRAFGMSGSDFDNLEMSNTLGQNNWNQADYATRFQTDQFNYLVDAQNRAAQAAQHNQGVMANAQQRGSIWQGVFSTLGSLVGGAAMFCWVAREIFGDEEIKGRPVWEIFRAWMLRFANPDFLRAYIANGEKFARYIEGNERAKAALRPILEAKVNQMLSYGF